MAASSSNQRDHRVIRPVRRLRRLRFCHLDFDEQMASIVWVKPTTIAQIVFTEWTDGGAIRHARFIGLGTDKRPEDVVREG